LKRHGAQGIGRRVRGAEHRAKGTEHRAIVFFRLPTSVFGLLAE